MYTSTITRHPQSMICTIPDVYLSLVGGKEQSSICDHAPSCDVGPTEDGRRVIQRIVILDQEHEHNMLDCAKHVHGASESVRARIITISHQNKTMG